MNADTPIDGGFVLGFPSPGERVTVTRRSGKQFVARLWFKPNAIFRDVHNLHWMTDDDKFADVKFDPIVSWSRQLCDKCRKR